MKRVETISINGTVFSIDDDAFGKLGAYLDALGKYFEHEQGGREIIADIEARIAELFTERNGGAQVITLADVTGLIETLGTPEDITGADADFEPPRPVQPENPTRRLYRDPDHRYLGGVCSGIATWLGISPLALRLAFLILLFLYGISAAVYCLLWIIIPKARTTAQKLEMRGEPVTVSNIGKNIRENFSDQSLKHSFSNFLNEAGEFTVRAAGVFGRIICIITGLFLFFTGVCFAISAVSLFLMQDFAFNYAVDWDFLSFTELFRQIISPSAYTILLICTVLTVTLTVFALLFWGARLVTGFRVKRKLWHAALSVLWVAAIVTGIIVCISQVRNFAWRNDQIVETRPITPSDTVFLTVAPSNLKISNNPTDIYFDKDNHCFYGKPNLDVLKSDDGQAKLKFGRESQGESRRAAYQYAENIVYTVDVRGSTLTFDPYFTVSPQNRWKFQALDVILYVPEGTIIVADNALCRDRVLGHRFRWHSTWAMPKSTWIMTKDEGLRQN